MLQHPKALAHVRGRSVEYLLAGTGNPAIVLLNGGDGPIEGWYKVLPALYQASTTLAYNRAGVGRTSPLTEKQTSDVAIAALRLLLQRLELKPPYLLVGHSLGGLHANFFARAHPEEVCGLAFLEATAPEDVTSMAALRSPIQSKLQRLSDFVFDRGAMGEARNAPVSARMVEAAGPFPGIPLAVISGGKVRMPNAAKQARFLSHKRLSKLTADGCHIIAERSGHFPQLSEPELVIATVLQILAEVRGRSSSTL